MPKLERTLPTGFTSCAGRLTALCKGMNYRPDQRAFDTNAVVPTDICLAIIKRLASAIDDLDCFEALGL
jgi:hypothetical protein